MRMIPRVCRLMTMVLAVCFSAATSGFGEDGAADEVFIRTLNELREKRGLAAMKLDPQITESAQWLADHMAEFGVMDHDAVVIGGAKFVSMKELGDRLKHFGFKDAGAAEACAEGEYQSEAEGARDMTLGWANGKTHYRPFLSQDGEVFVTCGFGIARSKKNPKLFYGCALFANRDGAAPEAGAGAGEPMANEGGGGAGEGGGPVIGGMVFDWNADWKLSEAKGSAKAVSGDGKALVVATTAADPKGGTDPWDAVQDDIFKIVSAHLPGIEELEEVETTHDVERNGIGLRVATYTASLGGKELELTVDFARENNEDGSVLVVVIRSAPKGDVKNQAVAKAIAESMRLKK
jgi:hypothetical protein